MSEVNGYEDWEKRVRELKRGIKASNYHSKNDFKDEFEEEYGILERYFVRHIERSSHNETKTRMYNELKQLYERGLSNIDVNEGISTIPQFGSVTLKIPPFFAVPYKSRKGSKIKWRLANPLTEMRNLANRQHKLSINLKRANVAEPELDYSIPRETPTLLDFNGTDRKKLLDYVNAVEEGKEEEYLFKNKPRGFPVTLYKNARKAGYRQTNEKVYRVNDKKAKPPARGARGRPRKEKPQEQPQEDLFSRMVGNRQSSQQQSLDDLMNEAFEDEDMPELSIPSSLESSASAPKKKRGRPRTRPVVSPSAPKRPVGRPRTKPVKEAKEVDEDEEMLRQQIKDLKEEERDRIKEIGDLLNEKQISAKDYLKQSKEIKQDIKERREELTKDLDEMLGEMGRKKVGRPKKSKGEGFKKLIKLNMLEGEGLESKVISHFKKDEKQLKNLSKAFKKHKKVEEQVDTEGGSLSAKDLKDLLGASYDKKKDKVNDFHLDKEISSKTSKVYYNQKTGQAVVAHMGTQGLLDWGNNAIYALGGDKAYKKTSRFKEAKRVQEKAEHKYGSKNVSTIGHSQGGKQAELLGKNTKEIITLNKATRPFENKKHENQYDIRTTGDIVSALNPFQKLNKKEIEIKSKSYNPFKEHSTDSLVNLDESQMIGEDGVEGGDIDALYQAHKHGKGLSIEEPKIIDWEDIKWGSFTKQFEEYKRQHPKSKIDDLEHFAESILENPSNYRKTTLKRARFYLNVLLKKKSPHNNMMPYHGGRLMRMPMPRVQHHLHPAMESDLFPHIPQAFTQVHLQHPFPIGGHGLYAGGGGNGLYAGGEMEGSGTRKGMARVGQPAGSRLAYDDLPQKGFGIKLHHGFLQGGVIPSPHSRSPITDPSLLGSGMMGSGNFLSGRRRVAPHNEQMREIIQEQYPHGLPAPVIERLRENGYDVSDLTALSSGRPSSSSSSSSSRNNIRRPSASGFKKGSAEAKAWGAKMKALRKK